MAEHEGTIKAQRAKIADSQEKLTAIDKERVRAEAEIERIRKEEKRLASQLVDMQRRYALTTEQKAEIEEKVKYMSYRHVLPDGKPALNPEQVRTAQAWQLKRQYFRRIDFCGLFDEVFRWHPELKGGVNWPFGDAEFSFWKQHGTRSPVIRADECVAMQSAGFVRGNSSFKDDIEKWERDLRSAIASDKAPWKPKLTPEEIIENFQAEKGKIEARQDAALRQAQEKYGDWESTVGEARRILARQAYDVSVRNATVNAASEKISNEYATLSAANEFRAAVMNEVKKLVLDASKGWN